jgi:hypothetical protein
MDIATYWLVTPAIAAGIGIVGTLIFLWLIGPPPPKNGE